MEGPGEARSSILLMNECELNRSFRSSKPLLLPPGGENEDEDARLGEEAAANRKREAHLERLRCLCFCSICFTFVLLFFNKLLYIVF